MLRATRPPGERTALHEARGEWPGETFSGLLDARARDARDRVYVIAGARDGDRSYTFGDLKRRAGPGAGGVGRPRGGAGGGGGDPIPPPGRAGARAAARAPAG